MIFLLQEVIASLNDICIDRYGRRVILYLLCPRSARHFSNQFAQILTPGDDNVHSKKPRENRWMELRNAITPPLIELASDKALEWACHKPMAPLLIQLAMSATGDVSPLYNSVAEGVATDENLISDPCGHWVLKRLIANQNEGTSV